MRNCWDSLVAPVLQSIRPRSVVEIGSGDGVNTVRLLALTAAWGGTVHAIDPLPRFAVAGQEQAHGARFRFHRALSLTALPGIERADAYLVGGDHNWYTVLEELRSIEGAARSRPELPFPVVFLEATAWPYARRDRYSDPRTIPAAHLHRFRRAGVLPGRTALTGAAGLAPECSHSLQEGEPGTGVLTALEDFLRETKRELAVFRIPAFHGMAIVADAAACAESTPLGGLLAQLRCGPVAAGLIEGLERARVEAEIAAAAKLRERTAAQVGHVATLNELARQRVRELRRLEERWQDEVMKHEQLKQRMREQKAIALEKDREIRRARKLLANSEQLLTAARKRLTAARQRLTDTRQRLTDTRQRLTDAQQRLTDTKQRLTDTKQRLTDAGQRIAALTGQRDRLARQLAAEKALAQFRTRAAARVAGHPLGKLTPRLVRAWLTAQERRGVRVALDAAWYLRTYPDVGAAGVDPADHYVRMGAFEGRNPAPGFSTVAYLLAYPDVAASGVNPFAHYARFGAAEGRKAVPVEEPAAKSPPRQRR